MAAEHFNNTEEVLDWFEKLPDEVLIFFGNLNWTLFHQPLSEDTDKINQIQLQCQQQFDVDLAHNLKLKDDALPKAAALLGVNLSLPATMSAREMTWLAVTATSLLPLFQVRLPLLGTAVTMRLSSALGAGASLASEKPKSLTANTLAAALGAMLRVLLLA